MLWIVIKPLLFAVCFVFGCASLLAQKPGWQPSPGHTQMPIWPSTPPDAQFGPPPNTETMPEPGEIDNVSRPTMTVYSPKGKNTGAAVVVFPGGGYVDLAIDLEGTEVCDWLITKGVTCVLLKYRVPDSGPAWQPRSGMTGTETSTGGSWKARSMWTCPCPGGSRAGIHQ